MPSKHTMNVSVTAHLHDFVATQIASGRFSIASEVVRAALRSLERELDGATTTAPDQQHHSNHARSPATD
jgi:putative addiction module CopG family antidote